VAARISPALASTAPEAIGADLALLLSYYRAATEFELLELDSRVLADRAQSGFSLCALAHDPETPTPQTLVSQSSRIYLLGPTYDENGNPDMDDVKTMLGYVRALQKEGKILSACAVCGNVLPALEKMSEGSLVEYLPSEPLCARPGSLLVETRADLPGTLLARSCVPSPRAQETE
jgi:hypothetical protein